MPKAWDLHKAELVQLYIAEGRTLKDVQDLLRRRHGFKASTRAYRMKIDEWGLRKYRSSKGRQNLQADPKPPERDESPTPSPDLQASSAIGLDTSEEVQLVFGDITIPTGPVHCSDLLRMIKGPYEYRHVLEILLIKWQPGGQYLQAALGFLGDSRACLRITEDPPFPNLFQLAETNVPLLERPILIKALLEADLSHDVDIFVEPREGILSWVKDWRSVAKETEWDDAKRYWYHSDMTFQGLGKTFRQCTLITIAERLLQRNKTQLENLRGLEAPLSASDSLDAERCRRQFVEILKDFYPTELDLHPSFYRYYLQIIEWDDALAKANQEAERLRQDRLAETQAKYRRLLSIYTGKPTESIDSSLDELLETATSSLSNFRPWNTSSATV